MEASLASDPVQPKDESLPMAQKSLLCCRVKVLPLLATGTAVYVAVF